MANTIRRGFLTLAAAAAVAWLGAIPVASASGFYRGRDVWDGGEGTVPVFVSGLLLFFLTLAVMGPAVRAGAALLDSLGRSPSKPVMPAALAMIASGTLCVLFSLYFAWASRVANPAADAFEQMRETMSHANLPSGTNFTVNVPNGPPTTGGSGGAGAMILTTLAFLLGTGLIGLGVWASLPPATSGGLAMKVPIPAADEARL